MRIWTIYVYEGVDMFRVFHLGLSLEMFNRLLERYLVSVLRYRIYRNIILISALDHLGTGKL